MDFPRPTSPTRYRPVGTYSSAWRRRIRRDSSPPPFAGPARVVAAQPLPQILQPLDRHRLRRVGRQRAVGDHGPGRPAAVRSVQRVGVGLSMAAAVEIACPGANA